MVNDQSYSERKPAAATTYIFYMHHPIDRIAHTTDFFIQVVKYCQNEK